MRARGTGARWGADGCGWRGIGGVAELSGPGRRSTYTSQQSGGVEISQYAWGSPREVPASTRKMRGSWRATCLYAALQLNATSPESAVLKKDIVDWIHQAKPEVMSGQEPFYLGIHLSNLVRDGILASFQPVREFWEETGFGKGRQAHMYYAVEGAGDKLDHRDPWPTMRSSDDLGRRGRVPRPGHRAARAPSSRGGGQCLRTRSRAGAGSTSAGGQTGEGMLGGGKGYGAGEGGLTIRQSQAALLRHVEVCRGRRAEFVLDRWQLFAPFFEEADRDLEHGPLARKLAHLRQAAVAADSLPLGLEPFGGRSRPEALLPVRGQPACILRGEMREYQVQGLRWMVQQHDRAAGGILGDEMGLGKTLQVPPPPPSGKTLQVARRCTAPPSLLPRPLGIGCSSRRRAPAACRPGSASPAALAASCHPLGRRVPDGRAPWAAGDLLPRLSQDCSQGARAPPGAPLSR